MTRDASAKVLQIAAGSVMVPLVLPFLSPKIGQSRALKVTMQGMLTQADRKLRGGRSPFYAGLRGHDGAWPSEGEHAVRPYATSLHARHPSGRAEGRSPSALVLSPKIEDPPQEEWGIKGVESLA